MIHLDRGSLELGQVQVIPYGGSALVVQRPVVHVTLCVLCVSALRLPLIMM